MKKIAFIDLDDTIIKGVNSTYDFIEWYLKSRYGISGCIRVKLTLIIIRILSQLIKKPSLFFRKVYLVFTLFGEPYFIILYYATLWIKLLIELRNINVNVLNVIRRLKSEGYNLVLLTASIDPVASVVRKVLVFDDFLSTKLKVCKGIVVGIEMDLYGHLKFMAALRKFRKKDIFNAMYVADKWSIENDIAHLFVKETVVVE